MTRTYNPAHNDILLTALHTQWKLTDTEIAERMLLPVDVVRDSRRRLGLRGNDRPDARYATAKRPDALKIAEDTLKGFNREAMTYQGRPIKLDEVMRLTNAALLERGKEQVVYNPAWKVEPCPA